MICSPQIIAVDPSPNGTAITYLDGPICRAFWYTVTTKKQHKADYQRTLLLDPVKKKDPNRESQRIGNHVNVTTWLFDEIIRGKCEERGVKIEYFGFEDYSYQQSASVYQIAELGGIIRKRVMLTDRWKGAMYDPSSVKLSWTGDGGADKDDMIAAYKLRARERPEYHPQSKSVLSLPRKYMEGVVDSHAVGELMLTEVRVRRGEVLVSDLPAEKIKIFNRVTSNTPFCLLDRPFL